MYKKNYLKQILYLTFFCVIVFILAFTPFVGYIQISVLKVTTVHIPVILASIILGPKKGAIVGFVFGLTSFLNNTFVSPTIVSFVFSPFYSNSFGAGNFFSLIICFVPRILTGVIPYFCYKLFNKVCSKFSIILASIAGSLTNTILVLSMIYVFFGKSYASAKNITESQLLKVIFVTIATNGLFEVIISCIVVSIMYKSLSKIKKIGEKYDTYY